MANGFITTDGRGQFLLDGAPWFLHGITYFGRRPGTCCGNWLGKHFAHNLAMLRDDVRRMRDVGLNTLGLFLPGHDFFDPATLAPSPSIFAQLDEALDVIAAAGLRTVVFPETSSTGKLKDAWCRVHGVDTGDAMWCPAVNEEAAKCQIHMLTAFAHHYAERPDVIGYMGRAGRFSFPGWDPPEALAYPIQAEWGAWLRERFDGDFARVRELLDLGGDETDWGAIKMPAMTPEHFSRVSARAYEYALLHQVLITRANDRLYRAVKAAAPKQLTINDMEGNEIPMGNCNVLIPEMCTADAIWVECYNWEGMRGTHDTDERHQIWFTEPVANKRTIELVNNAGYVQFLVRWMQQSGKGLILCHGTDVGNKRGVSSEFEQALMVDRFNAHLLSCGVSGITYWCWTDDELSRSAILPPEAEDGAEEARKVFWQAGETMGLLRYNGSERPLYDVVKGAGQSLPHHPPAVSPHEALVLCPTPIFMSFYRYRSNCTVYGILSSLARQGILADVAFTSAGDVPIDLARLTPYRTIVLGMPEYHRDHQATPETLRQYVEQGGTLFLPLALPVRLDDPYVKPRLSPALSALAGCASFESHDLCRALQTITARHPSFITTQTPSWRMDEDAWFTRVTPVAGAEILVEADGAPLLYRHRLGAGTVYVFTWTLDVHLFHGSQYDYLGGQWDWLWQGLAAELHLTRDIFTPMSRVLREMTYAEEGTGVPQ